MTSQEIRKQFLAYFESKNHHITPSAPIVLKDDPTLMFTNSGMNQFKDFFLGYKQASHPRIADTQKCLRVSGKHNDLDDVGKDTYHHTMFEMLGNWSFGDYFKKEAIEWAWELLTEVYKIPKENLYVTIFEGDETDGIPRDQEAYDLWKQFVSEDRILNGNKKDNFWEMGDIGPCGPCSEIHVDIRPQEEKLKVDGKSLVNQDHPQVIEVWNLVFMEFSRKADGTLEKLPSQNVDTGMGFERLCMVLQNKTSNYDTDVFTPLIQKLENISGVKYGEKSATDIAIRVIVDHVRAVTFAIADGQIPSNNGAGYVIRRILRRAISYGYRFLDLDEPFMYQLLPVLVNQMKDAFPELEKQQQLISEVIKEEEKNFLRTLSQGLLRLESIMQEQTSKEISGKLIYELHDTYGFPSDLSRIIAEEKGFTIDEKGFEAEKERIKNISRKASASKTFDWEILDENAAEDFVGYDHTQAKVNITRYRKIENKKGEFYQLVLDHTPFYAESGGQAGDSGYLTVNQEKIHILDTKKENNLIVHLAKELPSEFNNLTAKVDEQRRKDTMKNHSATHLLHQALREILGTHVEQKGSFVGPDYLRFDFSHFAKLTPEELQQVNDFVNDKIQQAIPLNEQRNVGFDQAVANGAMALFGEKYGDLVRTIQFGDSIELCGGTHVENTAQIQLFEVLSESSTAAGIRRIEAVTGAKAIAHLKSYQTQFQEIAEMLNAKQNPIQSVQKLMAENDGLKAEIEQYQKAQAAAQKEGWVNNAMGYANFEAIIERTAMDNGLIKDLIFELKSDATPRFILIMNEWQGKATLNIGISDALQKVTQWHAGNLVREWAKSIKGGGGGQPVFATAGGKDPNGFSEVEMQCKELLDNKK